MTNELSDAEAKALFAQISGSMNDPVKLDELMKSPIEDISPEPVEPVATPEPEEPKEEPETPSTTTEEPSEEEPKDEPKDEPKADEPKDELSELRAQLEKVSKENHALRSQAGRVPHLQRQFKELDRKLEELANKANSPSNRPSTTLLPKVKEALKGIQETDPDLADAVAKAIAEATDGLAKESFDRDRETLTLLRDNDYEAYREYEVSRLLQMYPNAKEVFLSSSFKEWKKEQPQGVIALVESDSADDVSRAFKLYADDMASKYPDLVKKQEPVQTPAAPAPSPEAAKIEEERNRKKNTAVSVQTPNAPGKSELPDDPEALFKLYSEQIRKQRSGG